MRERRSRGAILTDIPPFESWPRPILENIPSPHFEDYANNVLAVELWVKGHPENEIFKRTGLKMRQARRLVERCITTNPLTKVLYGCWACLPDYRVGARTRERCKSFDENTAAAGQGLSGALSALFKRYPDIRRGMDVIVKSRQFAEGAVLNQLCLKKLHAQFLDLCKRFCASRTEWPFNTKQKGYSAIRDWYLKKRYESPLRTADNEAGSEVANQLRVAYGSVTGAALRMPHLAYERVEIDEHYLDATWALGFPESTEHIEYLATNRLWSLVAIDSASKAVLSSCLAYGARYNRNDVMRLLRLAVNPPPRYQLTLADPEFRYAEDAAYPGEMEALQHNTWQTLAADNDASHISFQTWRAIEEAIGCSVVHERVGQATARPHIEGFFKHLTEMATWLPSATGNRADSPLRRNPEEGAKKHNVLVHLAEELLDVTCRNYNVTPNAGCGGLTPLFRLKEMVQKGEVFYCPNGALGPDKLWRLLPCFPAKLNRATSDTRVGPFYCELFGARYVSPELANSPVLSRANNWNATLYIEEDARFAYLVPEYAPELVFRVAVTGKYLDMPHTIQWRQAHEAFIRRQKMASRVSVPNSMLGFARGLTSAAKEDEKSAALLGGIISFMNRYPKGEVVFTSMEEETVENLRRAAEATDLFEDAEPLPPTLITPPRPNPGGVIFGD